uniref:4-hydroxy-tetrahydrodipicolinate reductase n=1 Tax=Alistipes sp. TaxID=1872444 RepID=UPI004056555E
MKAAIIGYGKMGREIEQILLKRGHEVVLIVDKENSHELDREHLKGVEVALEFTTPETAYENIHRLLDCGVKVVSGTTGWLARMEELKAHCLKVGGSLFYASNYCLGVNLLFALNRRLAQLMNRFGQYEVEIEEVHHTQKKDAPSGTAITLAEGILSEVERKAGWVNGEKAEEDEILIRSVREGMIPGIHTVSYSSEDDTLTLRHEIKNRRTLAEGAVIAAEFLQSRTGLYTMADLLGL